MSKRIRDSIEFTSMTHTARLPVNLAELSENEYDHLSDAVIAELKAIAEGKFNLPAPDDNRASSRLSEIKEQESVRSNRINVLSLGAYTVTIPERVDLEAQSNIATNEMGSIH